MLRETWATALGRTTGEQIKWALAHLKAGHPASPDADPSFPPSIPAFVALCRQAPQPEVPKLPAPTLSEQVKAKRIEQMAAQSIKAVTPGKEWAVHLRSSWLRGDPLLLIQASMAADALGETWGVSEDDHKRFAVSRNDAAA